MQHRRGRLVLGLLYYLGGWADGWRHGRQSPVALAFEMGPVERPTRSASLGAESLNALGHVTVWESGEVEAEVVRLVDDQRTLAISATVADVDGLDEIVRKVLAECVREEL